MTMKISEAKALLEELLLQGFGISGHQVSNGADYYRCSACLSTTKTKGFAGTSGSIDDVEHEEGCGLLKLFEWVSEPEETPKPQTMGSLIYSHLADYRRLQEQFRLNEGCGPGTDQAKKWLELQGVSEYGNSAANIYLAALSLLDSFVGPIEEEKVPASSRFGVYPKLTDLSDVHIKWCRNPDLKKNQRFGQYVYNTFDKSGDPWPELFYEPDSNKAYAMLVQYLGQFET